MSITPNPTDQLYANLKADIAAIHATTMSELKHLQDRQQETTLAIRDLAVKLTELTTRTEVFSEQQLQNGKRLDDHEQRLRKLEDLPEQFSAHLKETAPIISDFLTFKADMTKRWYTIFGAASAVWALLLLFWTFIIKPWIER